MSSRQEEKEKRRQERLAREQAEQAAAARKHRLGLVAAGLLGAAAVAAVIIAIAAAAGGGSEDHGSKTGSPGGSDIADKPVPAQQITDLTAAAKAAGCTVKTYPSEGRSHTTDPVTYKTNPPTSGNHNPNPADDGTYAPGQTPAIEHLVHTLEHGRIEIQYGPDVTPTQIGQLQTLVDDDGYHVLLFQNETKMPYAVAATAWTHLLGCKTFNDKVFDAIRAFRKRYVDQAPEQIP